MVVSGYYDDFTQVETERLSSSAEYSFKRLPEILGVALAPEPHKGRRFRRRFAPLGVEVNPEESEEGVLKFAPKEGRVSKVVEACAGALADDKMSVADARAMADP